MHTCAITAAAPGTTRATFRIAATSWVTVSWVATASSNTVESTHRLRRPRNMPVAAMTSATASNTRSGRPEAAIRLRQYTSVDGSKLIWVSDRPQATFHRISNFSASAVCGSDRSYSSLSTSTDPTRSAGSDGRPVRDGNKSAVNESGTARGGAQPRTRIRCPAAPGARPSRPHPAVPGPAATSPAWQDHPR